MSEDLNTPNNTSTALVVDLDGTLIKTDMLMESLMALLKQNFFACFLIPFWLLKGKAYLKNQIASRVELDVTNLPYNADVLAYIEKAKSQGRSCYLATGSVKRFADSIAEHLGIFDGVFATEEGANLTGSDKTVQLNKQFGKGQYDYIGNSTVDLRVWDSVKTAIVVTSSQSLVDSASKVAPNVEHIPVAKPSLKTWLKAMRVHQWVKNVLIAVPIITSHQFSSDYFLLVALGFLAFSLAASSVYVLNDLLDLESDRQHPSKCKRPFAAGTLSVLQGCVMFPVLLLASAAISAFLPVPFLIALALYYFLTLIYSFKIKRVIMLDTIMLAALYTMRIIAGTLLIAVDFSFWLLAFSMFIFLSLALVKRYTELVLMKKSGALKTIGRGYHADDDSMIASLGAASGYIAVMVFALYVDSTAVTGLYVSPPILWLACPILLYWISRVWILAHRGEMDDDPIVFAVKDPQSLVTGVCILAVFVAATVFHIPL
ncbi:MAG: UbiA family prenyltransferase [Pseudomonadales bacterium]|nr:UbiA family prenyltransferase [Pseudomonadales bacterium]